MGNGNPESVTATLEVAGQVECVVSWFQKKLPMLKSQERAGSFGNRLFPMINKVIHREPACTSKSPHLPGSTQKAGESGGFFLLETHVSPPYKTLRTQDLESSIPSRKETSFQDSEGPTHLGKTNKEEVSDACFFQGTYPFKRAP